MGVGKEGDFGKDLKDGDVGGEGRGWSPPP